MKLITAVVTFIKQIFRGVDTITVYPGINGDWRWNRKARNGKIIGASTEGYRNKRDCLDNIYDTQGGLYKLVSE